MINIYGITDKGRVREINEDNIYISEDERYKFCIIADGMGGANAGEVASSKAIEYARDYIVKNYTEASKKDITGLVQGALYMSNKFVYEMSISNEKMQGMGTTIIVLLIVQDSIYIGHIGDSSAYRIRKGVIQKLTKDHTYVQQLLDDKTITKQEAKVHPKRHMITKALGCDRIVEPDIIIKKLEAEDQLLLCTDGLTNLVKDKEILAILQESETVESATKQLIDIANDRGGTDNVSVILLKNN